MQGPYKEAKEEGGFSIGAACYPKAILNVRARCRISILKEKVDCGVDFLITQLFSTMKSSTVLWRR